MTFKPMLSASLDGVDLSTLRYPLVASPKLDGYRCIVINGVAYSRNMKPIPNPFVQQVLSVHHGLDGELIVGSPTEGHVLGRAAEVMRKGGHEPDFKLHVFDDPRMPEWPWRDRFRGVPHHGERVTKVPHLNIESASDLLCFEKACLAEGYEGVMLRDPNAPYKNGRSTLSQGWLMKLKRFIDGEGVVIGLEEAMENQNPATINALGHTERSSHKDNLVGKGMVGTIVIKDPKYGEMRLQPGIMPHSERDYYWNIAPTGSLIGQTVHWRAFGYGTKDAPRFARYYGIREDV